MYLKKNPGDVNLKKVNDVPKKREREERESERERERKEKKKEKLQPWLEKFQFNSIWEFMMIPLHTTTVHAIDCLIERLYLGISHFFYNLLKPCWLLDGPRIKRPKMTSWTSERRSFGTSF